MEFLNNNLFKNMRRGDFVLITFFLFISISFYLFPTKKNNSIEIIFHDKLIGTYSLENDKKIKISEDIIVQIKDHNFRMLKNNCPGQICVKQGWENDSPIICVPNELIIKPNSEELLITY